MSLRTRISARPPGGQQLITDCAYGAATGELTAIDYSDATPDVAFAYDRLGRLEQVTDVVGTRTFGYNGDLQLETETFSAMLYANVLTQEHRMSGAADRITLEGDELAFSSEMWEEWSLSITRIAIIGEYTTAQGPYLEDYFWVLVERSGRFHFAPMEAEGETEVFRILEERFGGTEWSYGLCGCTKLASHIVWPSTLAGKELFRFVRSPSKGLRRLFRFLIGDDWNCELTDEIRACLEGLPSGTEVGKQADAEKGTGSVEGSA